MYFDNENLIHFSVIYVTVMLLDSIDAELLVMQV